MNKPTSNRALLVGATLVSAALLVWLWRQTAQSINAPPIAARQISTPAPTVSSDLPPTAARLPTLSPEARALLTALMRALGSGNAREREAVLGFKDAAAMQRFLERAQKSGLTVRGQLDALHAVRVRFDSLSGLQRELLENGSDYADLAANGLIGIPQAPAKEDRAALNQ